MQSTPDIIWGCSASSLQIHNYTVHQIVWSKHISTFPFAIQRHFWPTCSKRGCYRSFMSPIHKQKHHLKCNIIKMRMELDHKKKATQTWRVNSSPLRKYFQPSPPRGGSSADFSKIFQTLNDLLAFKLNQRDLKLPDGDQELSYPCFQHFPAWLHSSPNKQQGWPALPMETQLSTPLQFSPAPLFYCCAPASFYTPFTGWLILILDHQLSSNSGFYTTPHHNSH